MKFIDLKKKIDLLKKRVTIKDDKKIKKTAIRPVYNDISS